MRIRPIILARAAITQRDTCRNMWSWLPVLRGQVIPSVVLLLLLGTPCWQLPTSVAQDRLEQLERQVRRELNEGDTTNRPESLDVGSADQPTGYFGIVADDRQSPGAGLRVLHVAANGPAARAGLRAGDLITAIDGQPIRQMRDLAQVMTGSRAGKTLQVAVQRDNRSHEVPVTLGQRPSKTDRLLPDFGRIPAGTVAPGAGATRQATRAEKLGLQIAPLTEAARRQHNLPVVTGVLVTRVALGSPAERAAVPRGAVIVAIGDQATTTPARLEQLIADAVPTGEIELTYYAHGELTAARLRLGTAAPPASDPRAAPLPAPALSPPTNLLERLEGLERRVEQLQRRIEELERSN